MVKTVKNIFSIFFYYYLAGVFVGVCKLLSLYINIFFYNSFRFHIISGQNENVDSFSVVWEEEEEEDDYINIYGYRVWLGACVRLWEEFANVCGW